MRPDCESLFELTVFKTSILPLLTILSSPAPPDIPTAWVEIVGSRVFLFVVETKRFSVDFLFKKNLVKV